MLKRLKKYASFYRIAHHKRVQMFHLTWRIFFILLVAAVMIMVNEYLQARSPYGVYDAIKGVKFLLADRIFEWFSIGVMFGVLALGAMNEGEFILSVRRLLKHFEMQTLHLLRRANEQNGKTKVPLPRVNRKKTKNRYS